MIIAAVGDIHVKVGDRGKWADYFKNVSKKANVLLLCGDLTDTGNIDEAEILRDDLKACSIPVIAVLGNHDYESNLQTEITKILRNEKVHILDGDSVVIENIGFAGVKGFGGGFDNYKLAMFGESMIKAFVKEAVDEAMKLDKALMRLESHDVVKKIAVLHYSPIKSTIAGEPEVIWPFLGSSRLADPINSWNVITAFHGHAHHGKLQGTTSNGVKVLNVSKETLLKEGFDPPFYIMEV